MVEKSRDTEPTRPRWARCPRRGPWPLDPLDPRRGPPDMMPGHPAIPTTRCPSRSS